MARQRFPFTTDQLELLLEFEKCSGLGELAETLAKDPSVISRNLQRLAEAAPVITKVRGRWQITPLGRHVNIRSEAFLKGLGEDIGQNRPAARPVADPFESSVLVVINAQQGLSDPVMGGRCNDGAESNIDRLLSHWRAKRRPIVHVRHVSPNPESVFFGKAKGVEFIPGLAPQGDEVVVDKAKANAFHETPLLSHLNRLAAESVVITGFTANECIDVTARSASDLGFSTYVVGDATASFDLAGPDGKLYKADRVHRLVLANLQALAAEVVQTEQILSPRAH